MFKYLSLVVVACIFCLSLYSYTRKGRGFLSHSKELLKKKISPQFLNNQQRPLL